jgi:hypothetical protein
MTTARQAWPASRQRPGEEPVHCGDGVRGVPFRTHREHTAARNVGVNERGGGRPAAQGVRQPLRGQERVRRDTERGVMITAPPAATLEMIEAPLVLQFLIVACDPPAQHGERCTSSAHVAVAGIVDSQYLIGAASVRGHSMSSHSSGRGVERPSSRCAGRTRTAAKRERIGPPRALAPFHRAPGVRGQVVGPPPARSGGDGAACDTPTSGDAPGRLRLQRGSGVRRWAWRAGGGGTRGGGARGRALMSLLLCACGSSGDPASGGGP